MIESEGAEAGIDLLKAAVAAVDLATPRRSQNKAK
jgi:hypothetical protein